MSRGKIEFIDGDGLPDIAVDFGRDLSEIPTRQLKVRTSTGVYITKTMLVDDAATGLGHFEFADGELPAGDHLFNIITTELDGRQRSYPASGSIPLLVRSEFSDSLRSNNRNGTITIRGEDTTLEIDVVQTDQRDGSLLLVGAPTDGDYTDGQAAIVVGNTIADAVDFVNVAVKANFDSSSTNATNIGTNSTNIATNVTNIGNNTTDIGNNASAIAALDGASLLVGAPTDGGYTDGQAAIVVGDTIADAVDFVNVALKSDVDNLATYGKWVIDGGNIYRNSLVGIGAVPDLGSGLHIKTADTGLVTAHAKADELVIEGGADTGLSIQAASNGNGWIQFGSGTATARGYLKYDNALDVMHFGSSGTIKMSLYGTYLNSTVPFRAPDGTVGEPGFVFGSDTNSGLHWVGADSIALVTGGVGALFVNASSVVGVGDVADLGAGLHVKTDDSGSASVDVNSDNLVIEDSGNSGISILSGVANYASIYFGDSTGVNSGRIRYRTSSGQMLFGTGGGTTRLTIDSTGKLYTADQILADVGSLARPTYSISGDVNSGLHWVSADNMGLVTAGVLRLTANDTGGIIIPGQYSQGAITSYTPVGTTETVDWDSGNIQEIDLASATGNVTLTLNNPEIGARYEIKVIQDATTPRNLVWPAAVKWPGGTAPTISVGASAVDYIYLTYDGTNYGGRFEQNLS